MDLLCQRHLAADASDCFSAGKTVSSLESCNLCFAVGGDDDDGIYSLVYAGFEQQRHIVNHHGVGVFSGGLSRQSGLFALDAGVDDLLKAAQFGVVSEDNGAERSAVDGAIRVEGGFTESTHDLSPRCLAWFDDIPRKLIGIDDDGAALLEHFRHGAFASGDAACEADQQHGCGA